LVGKAVFMLEEAVGRGIVVWGVVNVAVVGVNP